MRMTQKQNILTNTDYLDSPALPQLYNDSLPDSLLQMPASNFLLSYFY